MADVLDQLAALPGGAHLRDAAARAGVRAHLVGGAVRDLLLGRIPRELDVAVEGDIEPLVAALGGRAVRHPRFATAVVGGDGWCVDVARCRSETYPHPGALPQIAPADLATDLHRRDATINAIAVALSDGAVTAAPSAHEDLAARRLRVLHDAAFIDDPTRLWRLARYRARLGFALEAHTAALARRAVADGATATVSGERIGAELRLALAEEEPAAALGSIGELGLTPWLDPAPEPIAAALALLDGRGRRDLTVLAVALRDSRMLDTLGFAGAERTVVRRALAVRAGRHRPAGRRPSQIAAAYRGLPAEAVALAPEADRMAARRWLEELCDVTLAIDGRDLLAAGVPEGPQVGERLAAALAAVLDGEIGAGAPEQLAAALGRAP